MSQNIDNIKATASQTVDDASNKASEGIQQAHASGLEAKGQVQEQASGILAQASNLAQTTVDYAKGMVGLGKQKVDEGATIAKGHADNTKVTEDKTITDIVNQVKDMGLNTYNQTANTVRENAGDGTYVDQARNLTAAVLGGASSMLHTASAKTSDVASDVKPHEPTLVDKTRDFVAKQLDSAQGFIASGHQQLQQTSDNVASKSSETSDSVQNKASQVSSDTQSSLNSTIDSAKAQGNDLLNQANKSFNENFASTKSTLDSHLTTAKAYGNEAAKFADENTGGGLTNLNESLDDASKKGNQFVDDANNKARDEMEKRNLDDKIDELKGKFEN